jgi:hypothetical protein
MIKLVSDFDEDIGLWYVTVYNENEEVLFFRHGFRTQEEWEYVGDAWICEELDGIPDGED